jgi:hypothetical protein
MEELCCGRIVLCKNCAWKNCAVEELCMEESCVEELCVEECGRPENNSYLYISNINCFSTTKHFKTPDNALTLKTLLSD